MSRRKRDRRNQRPDPPRVPLLIMVTRPVYRIVQILAADDGVSVSRIGAGLIHDALGLARPDDERKRRR